MKPGSRGRGRKRSVWRRYCLRKRSPCADATARYVRISVIDNGIGVADEHKDKIFDRFYRTDSSRSQKDHCGLGLCIASELVRQQKGMIALHDTPGGGASFTVSMPACERQ